MELREGDQVMVVSGKDKGKARNPASRW